MSIQTVVEQIREAQEDFETSEEGISVNVDGVGSKIKLENIQHQIDEMYSELFEFKNSTAQRFTNVEEELNRIERMLQFDEHEYFQENKKIHLKDRFEAIEQNQNKLFDYLKKQAEQNQTTTTATQQRNAPASPDDTDDETSTQQTKQNSTLLDTIIDKIKQLLLDFLGKLLPKAVAPLAEAAVPLAIGAAALGGGYLGYKAFSDNSPSMDIKFAPYDKPGKDDELIAENQKRITESGLPEGLLKNLIHIESGGKQYAVSHKGAMGVGQWMPETLGKLTKQEGLWYEDEQGNKRPFTVEDAWIPKIAYQATSKYLVKLYEKYKKNNSPEEAQAMAIAAYNAGEPKVNKAIVKAEESGERGNWRHYLPTETQLYIQNLYSGEESTHLARSPTAIPTPPAESKTTETAEPTEEHNVLDSIKEFMGFNPKRENTPPVESSAIDGQSTIASVDVNILKVTNPELYYKYIEEIINDPNNQTQIELKYQKIIKEHGLDKINFPSIEPSEIMPIQVKELIKANEQNNMDLSIPNDTSTAKQVPLSAIDISQPQVSFGSSAYTDNTPKQDKIASYDSSSGNQQNSVVIMPITTPGTPESPPRLNNNTYPSINSPRQHEFPDARNNESTYMNILLSNYNILFPNFSNFEV